jgi:hypothetical protein
MELTTVNKSENNIPIIINKSPGINVYSSSSFTKSLPSKEENLPSKEENLPSKEENLPSKEENLPSVDDNLEKIFKGLSGLKYSK